MHCSRSAKYIKNKSLNLTTISAMRSTRKQITQSAKKSLLLLESRDPMKNAYPINIIPDNDAQRVAALARYGIFNASKEAAFDNIAHLAKTIFGVPVTHVSFLDADHEFVMANTGLGEMGLIDRGESLCALTVLKPEVIVIEDALKEPLLENHPFVHGEFGLRFYAGAPIVTPDDYVIGTLCLVDKQPRTLSSHEINILRDLAKVTMEQVELRRANIEHREKLNFLISQKDEFIGVASHELKTPLTSLKAYLQLIDRAKPDAGAPTLPHLIQKANDSLDKLNALVNDMLTANRLTTGFLTPKQEDFNIQEAIYNCCSDVQELAPSLLEIKGDQHLWVYADRGQISQAVRNLFDNAKKYTTGIDKVYIEVSKSNDKALIRITDNGPGIPRERLPKLFERYHTYNAKMQLSGLGLGLYISADLIKSNGGEIGVESEVGKGATFWFTLPLSENQPTHP